MPLKILLCLWIFQAASALPACTKGEPACKNGGPMPNHSEQTPLRYKVAYIGDTGINSNFKAVLRQLKTEGVQAVFHAGDLAYDEGSPAAFNTAINDVFGGYNFPYMIALGNHDAGGPDAMEEGWALDVSQRGWWARVKDHKCAGWSGLDFVCSWSGITWVMLGTAELGTDSSHVTFVNQAFDQYPAPWRVCVWHKHWEASKNSASVYEACRRKGAMIVTGHEHLYKRSHGISSFGSQPVISTRTSDYVIDGTNTVMLITGIGGVGMGGAPTNNPAYWQKVLYRGLSSFGAVICSYNDGAANKASCVFKDMTGASKDAFTVTTKIAAGAPTAPTRATPTPAPKPTAANPCVCKATWTSDEPGCTTTQRGCAKCDGSSQGWCVVQNPGCDTAQTGGDWAYCTGAPAPTPKPAGTCVVNSWTKKVKVCTDAPCKVLALTSPFPTCRAYCAAQGHACDKAYEDTNDSCTAPYIKPTETNCDTNFFNKFAKTSDMICVCKTVAAPQGYMDEAEEGRTWVGNTEDMEKTVEEPLIDSACGSALGIWTLLLPGLALLLGARE